MLTFNSEELGHYDAKGEALVGSTLDLHFSGDKTSGDVKRVG